MHSLSIMFNARGKQYFNFNLYDLYDGGSLAIEKQ